MLPGMVGATGIEPVSPTMSTQAKDFAGDRRLASGSSPHRS